MGQQLHVLLVLLLFGYCFAGPVRDLEVVAATSADDVCTVKNETYTIGEVVPDVAPCETCVCEPPDIKCSVIKCQVNNGCKIIQQSGKCCPEYKCDCEHEGKLYNNGEKLDNPSSPCQVCYCRGGEIMCNSITCYRRDDCEPQHIEGQCCPKYGHCPSKNSSSVVAVSADPTAYSTKREMQPWLLTKSVNLQTTETPKYPQTIKIVEILPTQAPARAGEASLVPRIITNGGPDFKSTSSLEPVTESYSESSSASAELKLSKESPAAGDEESVQPASETYTTLLPHMVDVTTTYEELSAQVSAATEGTGYDIETGGTFFPQSTKDDEESSKESKEKTDDSSEEHNNTTASPTEHTTKIPEKKQSEFMEGFVTENQTTSANLELENIGKEEEDDSAETTKPTSSSDVSAESSEDTSKYEGVVTKHGLTIPPILNLNHQLHHLTLGGTGEEMEEKSVVRIGVYDPTKPGEKSNLVTVIKNEESSSGEVTSAESATTQILLTPQDLKTLAEMIIKEKIKAPNEKLVDGTGTTPLPTESYEETSVASPVDLATDDGVSKSSPATVEETTPSSEARNIGVKPHNLTKEEEKAQAVIDRLMSNILQPLQGIELVDANDTTTTEPPVEEVSPVGTSLPPGNKDAEWVSNSTEPDKTDKVVEGETSPKEDDDGTTAAVEDETATSRSRSVEDFGESTTESSSAVESVTVGETGKPRGSLRQMDTKEPSDRRTRVTVNEDMSKHASIASLDENDRMLVENFFKKALDFQ